MKKTRMIATTATTTTTITATRERVDMAEAEAEAEVEAEAEAEMEAEAEAMVSGLVAFFCRHCFLCFDKFPRELFRVVSVLRWLYYYHSVD